MAYVLGLLLVLCSPFGTAIPLSSFYQYGSSAGDDLVPRGLDVSSQAIWLPTPFPFFGTSYIKNFVNNHGDLTFSSGYTGFMPITFPVPALAMIAPFLADVDTTGTGYVWYRATNDAALIAKAVNDISAISSGHTFNPCWLFIATWDHVGYHSNHIDKTNTFQCILATNNIQSYAIFLYADGLMQWTTGDSANGVLGLGGTEAQIGLNAGDNVKYFSVPGSRTPAVMNITHTSNVLIPGQWVFQLENVTAPNASIGVCATSHGPCQKICTSIAGSFNCCCNAGYNLSQYICNDINECLPNGGLGTCQHNCTNTIGSYYCSCKPGYALSPNGSSCYDINECSSSNGNCTETCTNTIGSYFCSCTLGYIWNTDSKTCLDINECMANVGNCSQLCTNTIGSYVCSCLSGYVLTADGSSCNDINECESSNGNCSGMCTNTIGSYSCSCTLGYVWSVEDSTCLETNCQKAPIITIQPESMSTMLGSKVMLLCQVSGCPSPQITWYKDNVAASTGQYLIIQTVALSDRGFYVCKAVNEFGSASSSEAKVSIKGIYQYTAHLEVNISTSLNIVAELSTFLTGRYIANGSAYIILANISQSGTTINVLITLVRNESSSYNALMDELHYLLSVTLEYEHFNIINVQRFDGCPFTSICGNRYVWLETEIGAMNFLSPCIKRRCGGTYSTGGQWEPVILTCPSDYVSCAVSELENLVEEALNNTQVANRLLSGVDNLINTNNDGIYRSQDMDRLLNLLNYYSNNAIINETTVFAGKVFATQLEDINISKGCFTGRNFSINVGSYDEATAGNTTIDRNAIGSKSTENTTASVYLAPLVPDNCINTGSSVYRLAFYTFLKNTLFQSPQQEKEGYKLGSIIISVGGSAIPLADKLQFTFQVSKDANSAKPAQWIMNKINGTHKEGMWVTEGSRVISKHSNIFITETLLTDEIKKTVYQSSFGMLLDLNPGGVSCPAAEILTVIGTTISIISLVFFIITYLSSKPLRRSQHGQVLINISCALLCLYTVFVVSGYTTSVPAICGISAALVHYFMLVYFMWTLAEAVLLYIKLVKVLGNNISSFSFKAGLLSWLVPLFIVVVSAGAGYRYYYNQNYCRATGLPFYLGFILPFSAIYVFNWFIFVVIMISIGKHSARSAVKQSNDSGGNDFTLRNVLIAAGLALVLGLGWGFGLAASSHNISALACAFQFVFSLFVSSQGLLLLIFHGVRSKDAKVVWRSWFGFHSKFYSVGRSTFGDTDTIQKGGRTAIPQPTHCTEGLSITLDEKSCSKDEDSIVNEEKTCSEVPRGNSLHGPINAVIVKEDK